MKNTTLKQKTMLSERKKEMFKRLIKLDYITSNSFWALLILGVLLFVAGLIMQLYGIKWAFILITIGQTFLVSVLFSVISKSTFFLDYFSDILEDIIYSSGHIDHRDDKEQIWDRITQCLFHSKIPGLHKEISKAIKASYIPDTKVSFYENFRQIVHITWEDKENKILRSDDHFVFYLNTNDEKKFTFSRECWIPNYKASEIKTSRRQITSYKVNGVDQLKHLIGNSDTIKPDSTEFGDHYTISIELEGSTKYKIDQTTTRLFSLKEDCYSGFKAKWIVKDMDVRISFPEDLKVQYLSRGTNQEFDIIKNDKNTLDIEYKGLILQNQGYVLIFSEK